MREIKFRAWDKEKECWYEPIHEAYRGNLFELSIGFKGDLYARTMHRSEHESLFPDRFELMQYVGEKDCEGREIWENDIYSDCMGYLYQVLFGGGCFYLLSVPDTFNHKIQSPLSNIINSELKYEGNPFEKPELLELKCFYCAERRFKK